MIQIRRQVFETNSSSTHCLSVVKRSLYDDWREHKVALSIEYVYGMEEGIECDVKISNKLPENFNNFMKARLDALEKRRNGDDWDYYFGMHDGDNGFMNNWGNFGTYASMIRVCDIDERVNENVKILDKYYSDSPELLDGSCDNMVEFALEQGRELANEYKKTGVFTKEMFDTFPDALFFTPEEYEDMLKHNDVYSPFIHIYPNVVAFVFYFHS